MSHENRLEIQTALKELVDFHIADSVNPLINHFARNSDALHNSGYSYECDLLPILEQSGKEALEHWSISPWLAEKLKRQGEMIGEFFGLTIWGRTTSGQAIYMDSVIEQIARDCGILPKRAA